MSTIYSAAVVGIQAIPVAIETDIAFGLSAFTVVGLPDTTVKEARERIRSAIKNSDYPFPRVRITVNLAPADIKKQGPLYDLPIAISILLAEGEFDLTRLEGSLLIGELALDGSVRPVHGVLAIAMLAKERAIERLYVPVENAEEAACVRGLEVIPVKHVRDLVQHLKQEINLPVFQLQTPNIPPLVHAMDFAHIKGQRQAKRGLEIAAAGGHNVLLFGPPGTGKTLLARSLPSILPPLAWEESLEVTAIASVAGHLPPGRGLIRERPFRTPHHSCSAVALIGGGSFPKPGEVSLSHRGVLFLDELPEFSRQALEHLRQPLEDGVVTVSRAAASVQFPARFLLCAAMNPCPCGYANDRKRTCVCSTAVRQRYRRRLSGPLLDRFDLLIEVPQLEAAALFAEGMEESSEAVRGRVEEARKKQHKRLSLMNYFTNAEIPARELEHQCAVDKQGRQILEQAVTRGHLSARAVARVRKVARTIADLDESEMICLSHVAEAMQYRLRDVREEH